jgi:hypothetical protein
MKIFTLLFTCFQSLNFKNDERFLTVNRFRVHTLHKSICSQKRTLTTLKTKESNTLSNYKNNKFSSYAALFMVPILWGTYSPVVKELYNNASVPPPTMVFNLFTYMISFFTLALVSLIRSFRVDPQTEKSNSKIVDDRRIVIRAGFELGLLLLFGSTLQIIGICRHNSSVPMKHTPYSPHDIPPPPVFQGFKKRQQLAQQF